MFVSQKPRRTATLHCSCDCDDVCVALVDYVLLSDENRTFDGRPDGLNLSETTSQLFYTEHQHGLVRCVAFGGSPPPDVELYVGRQDITSRLTLNRSPTVSRDRGLRLVYYTTELSTDRLQLTADDDGALMRCVVTVPGSPSNVTTALITVHCQSYYSVFCLTLSSSLPLSCASSLSDFVQFYSPALQGSG